MKLMEAELKDATESRLFGRRYYTVVGFQGDSDSDN